MNTLDGAPALLVADSFRVRVRDGAAEVRGFSRHLERFAHSVGEALASGVASDRDADLAAFLADARRRIAAFGEGFPRLELWRDPDGAMRYGCALRPLPELRPTIALASVSVPPLPGARIKGPNIGAYAALNRDLDAEALLVGSDGRVREGATTSLVFWRDERDESGHVVDHGERVASVTEAILLAAAQQRLVGDKPHRARVGALRAAPATVAELQRCEVWAVNALHGIRPVTHIDGTELPRFNAARLRWFEDALDRAWEPVLP